MKISLIQKMYAYITLNPGCTTSQVCQYIDRPSRYVSGWLARAEAKGQVRAVERGAGRRPTTWAVTNRPVRFNTGETVKAKKPKIGVVHMTQEELKDILAMLAAKLEA